jgi:hypothetical protein
MARSPFQGTYQSNARPTVVTAPDALVFINGEQDIIGCSGCRRKFDLSKYITSIQTNLSVDSSPGSATISLSVPRHALDDLFFDDVPAISPMMEVEIFAKGYFLLEGVPQYYPIFWGLVTEVSDAYSSGEHTVTINCADILKWWEICRMNVNPALSAPTGQLGRNIFGNALFGTNPYDIIFSLSQMAFGDIILATGSLNSLYQEKKQKQTFNAALGDIMAYWATRFTKMRSNLLLYGIEGVAVRGATLNESLQTGQVKKVASFVSSAIRQANGENSQVTFDPTSDKVVAFRSNIDVNIELWQQDYQTKLEIANACKEAIGFEFYMDVTGDIVFKPPFYNMDILSNKPVSWIQDIDVIDWDFSDSEAEVVTHLTLQGSYAGNVDVGLSAEATPLTSVTDYHLLRKYGWRPHTYNSEFLGKNLQTMFHHGLDVLDRINSKRHSATVTIPMRPELRLGFPIYLAGKDQLWYINGISHNIQFGGRATTSLTLTARREKFKAPRGISMLKVDKKGSQTPSVSSGPPAPSAVRTASYKLDLGDAASMPGADIDADDPKTMEAYEPLILRHPKTGRIVGYPNAVMVYSRPYVPTPEGKERGQKAPGKNNNISRKDQAKIIANQKKNNQALAEGFVDSASKLANKYAHNRFTYGLTSAGVYVYAYDKDKYISQMVLIPEKNITVVPSETYDSGVKSPTTMIRPVSDERGFEVIGHYRYGRGVSLRDGSLVINEGKPNTRTGTPNDKTELSNVGDMQLALTGGLLATLNAQSQGLTTQGDINPADAVARLVPEDLQTAATLVPGQGGLKKTQFTDTGTNFVDTAPLGSPEQSGLPASVEASQLSRALTLAEMTVKFDLSAGDQDCECQMGRADLAFITTGYQVRTIADSSPTLDDLTTEELGPVSPATKGAGIVSQVETYLFNLYKALDDTHQAHENALRGDYDGTEPSEQVQPDLFTTDTNPVSGIAPPFSAMNRAAMGDPTATALQGKSSKEDLKNSFQSFSDQLKKSTNAKKLGSEIAALSSKIARLEKRIEAKQNAGPGTVNLDNVKDLTKQLAEAEQDRAKKEGELGQLTA